MSLDEFKSNEALEVGDWSLVQRVSGFSSDDQKKLAELYSTGSLAIRKNAIKSAPPLDKVLHGAEALLERLDYAMHGYSLPAVSNDRHSLFVFRKKEDGQLAGFGVMSRMAIGLRSHPLPTNTYNIAGIYLQPYVRGQIKTIRKFYAECLKKVEESYREKNGYGPLRIVYDRPKKSSANESLARALHARLGKNDDFLEASPGGGYIRYVIDFETDPETGELRSKK